MTASKAKPRGRTLWDIMTGRNRRDLTPLELQYHNPLGVRVGAAVTVDHDAETAGVNFLVERVAVYETRILEKKFCHTDYHLKGLSTTERRSLRARLRLLPDEDATNEVGCRVQFLRLYDEMGWDEEFYNQVLGNASGVFAVNQDDAGATLETPRTYWRVAGVTEPYAARVTTMADKDGNGVVEESELERSDVTYWEYHRETDDEAGQPFVEFLTVEMDNRTHYFTLLRGRELKAFQVTVF